MNVVITGGFGFLGSYVVQQCKAHGFFPIVLKRKESENNRLENFSGFTALEYSDMNDESLRSSLKLLGPTCFIHIAWKGVDRFARNLDDQLNYNLKFTLDTVKLAIEVGCKHWVGIGSLTEYNLTRGKVDELQATIPFTIYGKAKLASCWASSAMCQANGVKWSWIRVGSIYGPGDNDNWLIPYVIKTLLKGEAPQMTPSEQFWDYLYIEDAADAILTIAKNQSEGIFNLGSGKSERIKTIVTYINNKLKSNVKPAFGAQPYSALQIMHMEANIEKLTNTTGWTPKVSFDKGIEKTIEYFKLNSYNNA